MTSGLVRSWVNLPSCTTWERSTRTYEVHSLLTTVYRGWGCGLCFLHLCNVKGLGSNHERV